jgi:hypothetical protein
MIVIAEESCNDSLNPFGVIALSIRRRIDSLPDDSTRPVSKEGNPRLRAGALSKTAVQRHK